MIAALFLISLSLHASFPEFFGTNALTESIAGQPQKFCDPGNNYYSGAILANCDKSEFSYAYNFIDPKFDSINNIVVENSTMSSDASLPRRGDADTNYKSSSLHAFHLLLPSQKLRGNFSLSLFTPLSKILTQDSGDPFLPEYVLHRARYKRTELFLNYAYAFNSIFSASLGTHIGFNASSSLNAQTSLNGTEYGSSGSAKTEVKPLAGILFSAAYQKESSLTFFTYAQGMESELLAETHGETSNPPLPFYVTVESQLYFDPTIFRLGNQTRYSNLLVNLLLEYQLWDKYKTPRIFIKKNSGVVQSSDDYERIQTENIFIPKVGLTYSLPSDWSVGTGAFYRKSPLRHSLAESGNSLDSDTKAVTMGISKSLMWDHDPLTLSLASQYHWLTKRSVVKKSGAEDGSAGDKIGAGGYQVGGRVFIISTGLNLSL